MRSETLTIRKVLLGLKNKKQKNYGYNFLILLEKNIEKKNDKKLSRKYEFYSDNEPARQTLSTP